MGIGEFKVGTCQVQIALFVDIVTEKYQRLFY